MFDELDPNSMWELSTRTKVELLMRKKALSSNFEHPSQSLILVTNDPCWLEPGFFTVTEMEEIKTFYQIKNSLLVEFPKKLKTYAEGFKGKKSFDEIWTQIASMEPNPKSENDLSWIKDTMKIVNNLFMNGDVLKFHPKATKIDIIIDLWNFIKTIFTGTGVEIVRSAGSLASSERKNANSNISAEERMEKMVEADMDDLHFYYGDYELGASEFGVAFKGKNDTKRKLETDMKLPKMLRDVLVALWSRHPTQLREFVLPGFIVNHLTLGLIIMDCPAGYANRVTSVSELEFPSTIGTLATKMIRLLTLIYNVKELIIQQIGHIEDDDDVSLQHQDEENDDDEEKDDSGRLSFITDLPFCFTPDVASAHKKQRTSNNTSEE